MTEIIVLLVVLGLWLMVRAEVRHRDIEAHKLIKLIGNERGPWRRVGNKWVMVRKARR